MRIIVVFVLLVLLDLSSKAQTLNVKESGALQGIIHSFFYNSDITKRILNRKGAPSEAFLCLLTVNREGKIADVHLLSDQRNRDSAFFVLSALRPDDFKMWKAGSARNKTILIPLALLSDTECPKYAVDFFRSNAFNYGDSKNLIILRGIDFAWPKSYELSKSN